MSLLDGWAIQWQEQEVLGSRVRVSGVEAR